MKRFPIYALLLGGLLTGFLSCSDNEGGDSGSGGGGNGEGGGSVVVDSTDIAAMTPTESKQYLETSAQMVMDRFVPAEQEELITLANYFVNTYEDYDMPEEWNENDEAVYNPALTAMRTLAQAFRSGRYTRATQAVSAYRYAFADYAGVYEPGNGIWVKTAPQTDAIIFRFPEGGVTCEVKATASTDNYHYVYTEDNGDTRDIEVPKVITLSITRGDRTLLSGNVQSAYSSTAHTLEAYTNISAMNVNLTNNLSATDDQVNEECEVYVNNERIVHTNATVTGQNLCTQAEIERIIREEDEDGLYALFNEGTAYTDILGRVQVKATLTDLGAFVDALNYDENDGYTPDAEQGAQQAADKLNECLNARVYYGGTSILQATLQWQPNIYETDSWSGNNWWSPEALIRFDADGSTYSLESYFGEGRFANTEDLFENLLDQYEAFWK